MFPLTRWHSAWAAACAAAGLVAAVPAMRHNASPAAEPVRVTRTAAVPASGTRAAGPLAASLAPRAGDAPLYVHVTGEVPRPGLYRFPPGARVMDAVTGAGGGTANADLSLLNLAAPLRDGQQLRVPRAGETPRAAPEPVLLRADPPPAPAAAVVSTAASRPASSGKLRHPGDGVVHLNSAVEPDLERLPGVGPSTAAKILAYRAAHGGFRNVDEMLEVKGIGPKKLARMRPFLSVP